MLFFILEFLISKNAFKTTDGKNILNQVSGTNINSVFIPSSSDYTNKKALNSNGLEKVNRTNSLNSLNNFTPINNMGSSLPLIKSNSEGVDEKVLRSLVEKFLEIKEPKRDKADYIPMLTSSNETENINNILNGKVPVSGSIEPANINTSVVKELKRNLEIDSDQNSILFRNPSPNPFIEEMNFSHSNIFASPRNGDNLSWRSAEGPKNLENADNILCLNNNFEQTPLTVSRNNSMDLNELYFKSHPEDQKKSNENIYVFDDSYFSVSSERYKSETKSEK